MFRQSTSEPDACCWHMVMVKGGEEKRIRGLYTEWGVFAFYPTRIGMMFNRSTRKYEKKKVPLFKTFLFVKFPQEPNWLALKDRGMASGVLSVAGVPYRFSHDEIVAVRNMSRTLETRIIEIEPPCDMTIREGDTVGAVPDSLAEIFLPKGKTFKVKEINQMGIKLSGVSFMFCESSLRKEPIRQA